MSDQSPYSIEERLVASVWVHQRNLVGWTWATLRSKFEEQFRKTAPKKERLKKWEIKAFRTGSVLDLKRCGRPITRQQSVERVKRSVESTPIKSTKKIIRT